MPLPWKRLLSLALLPSLAVPSLAAAQQAASTPQSGDNTIRANSTLIVVPTRVQGSDGQLVHELQVNDFLLADNGQQQSIRVEEPKQEPLAVVVLMQTGGTAPRQFGNYTGVGTMLEYALSQTRYRISLVTYDSKPEDCWPFSPDVQNLRAAFSTPKGGDKGAATLDAIEYGMAWFDDQHPRGRRVIVLIGDERFAHPAEQSERIVKRLAETNTTIYTLNYSSQKQWLKDEFTKERHENPPYYFGPGRVLMHTFNLDRPLREAFGAMQENSAEEMASLSGGVALPFSNRAQLEEQMTVFANDLTNRYLLSFQSTNSAAGLHSLSVQIPQHPEYRVSSRAAYWRDAEPQH